MKKKKTFKIIICIVVMALIGVAVFLLRTTKSQGSEQVSFTVVREEYEDIIEISGTVEAAESQTLQVAGDGTVEAVYVEEGDYVHEGDILLELNNSQQEYNLAKHDYEMEQKRINGSAREVELMETERDTLLEQLEDRQVIAMFDGIIAELTVAEGDVFESKDEVGTLINRDYLSATIEVVETDVSRLKIGQVVYLTFPAYNDVVEAKVVSWPSVARISNSGATVVDVKIRIDNPPNEILPNYSFIGEIEISPMEEMLLVEKTAIGRDGEQSFVEVVGLNGSTEKRSVEVEAFSRTHVVIKSGLTEGDVVLAQDSMISGMDPDLISEKMQLREGSAMPMGASRNAPMGGGAPR